VTATPILHPGLDELTACDAPPPATAVGRTESPGCGHTLGGLPCLNRAPHAGRGRGCVHHSESGVPDRHDQGDDE